MFMNYSIREYNKSDLEAILNLIMELAIFEKAPEKVKNSVEQMEQEMEHFDCFVAETDDGQIVGMALYYPVYYTWVGKSMYLDDLIVTKQWRGNGIGTKLLDKVIQKAKNSNCKRIRWQVLDWNEEAIKMYRNYGCKLDKEWVNCDLSFN